jgi:hypothetical protein
MDVIHYTPFVATLTDFLDKDGSSCRLAILKATFQIGGDGSLRVAPEQEPIYFADEFLGEPGLSSVRNESDLAFFKPGTDIILIGTAYAPHGKPARSFQASLSVGGVSRTVSVFGDRTWSFNSVLGATMSDPKPFAEMPICWERAFGGVDTFAEDPKKHQWEERNPIGTGFRVTRSAEALDGMALPNFEDPKHLIRRWQDKPAPQGFGYIGRSWAPRAAYAGTYDEAWQKHRMPILPEDFDYRFFQGAPPGLIHTPPLTGREPVTAVNLSTRGDEHFRIPSLRVRFEGTARKQRFQALGTLDTLVLLLDECKIVMVWRHRYAVRVNESADTIDADVDILE